MAEKIVLKYVGQGSLISIPARDLTQQDLDNIVWTGWDINMLVDTGIYERVIEEKKIEIKKKSEVTK